MALALSLHGCVDAQANQLRQKVNDFARNLLEQFGWSGKNRPDRSWCTAFSCVYLKGTPDLPHPGKFKFTERMTRYLDPPST